ncbi:MAG: phosphopantetheine-binding protein [Acidobacteriota bacterium]
MTGPGSSDPGPREGDAILEGLAEIARDELGFSGPLHPEQNLVRDLELDSIRLLTLAMAVEDRFRICLDEDDEAGIDTVSDLVSIVESKLAESG